MYIYIYCAATYPLLFSFWIVQIKSCSGIHEQLCHSLRLKSDTKEILLEVSLHVKSVIHTNNEAIRNEFLRPASYAQS